MKRMPKIEMIAAVDDEWGIGRHGVIPWNVPADMAFFRQHTTGHPTLMGRKTFESIGAKPLSLRPCAVWSHHPENISASEICFASSDLNELVDWCLKFGESVQVIGGASVYAAMLNRASVIWLSRIPGNFQCDEFFPEISEFKLEKSEILDGFTLEKYVMEKVK